MSDEQNQPGQSESKNSDVLDELRQFGQQIEALFTTALQSERTRQLQQDIANGVREIGNRVTEAMKTVQDNPKVQELEERGRQAIKDARDSQVLDKVQDTLVQGLSQLNVQVSKLVENLKREQSAASGTSTHSVPIDKDESSQD